MPRLLPLSMILVAQILLAPAFAAAAGEPLPPGVPQAQADMFRRTHQLLLHGERAYLATTVGVLAVDISAPARPRYTGALLLQDSVNDLALAGSTLLAANGPAGLVIAALDAGGSLRQLARLRLPGAAMGVAVAGKLALVASGTAGLQLVDLSRPEQPRKLQQLDTAGYCRDVVVRGDLVYAGDGSQIVSYRLKGTRLQPLSTLAIGGQIYELALRQRTLKVPDGAGGLGLFGTARSDGPRPGWTVSRGGQEETILQERLLVVAAGTAGMVLVDVSRPEAPRILGRAAVKDTAHGIALAGHRAALADGTAGLALWDLSRPAQPRELARQATLRPVNKVSFIGERIYAANDYDGLLVLQINKDGTLQAAGALPAR